MSSVERNLVLPMSFFSFRQYDILLSEILLFKKFHSWSYFTLNHSANISIEIRKLLSLRNHSWTESVFKIINIDSLQDKVFKGTLVNRNYPSLYGGSLKTTLIFSLLSELYINNSKSKCFWWLLIGLSSRLNVYFSCFLLLSVLIENKLFLPNIH